MEVKGEMGFSHLKGSDCVEANPLRDEAKAAFLKLPSLHPESTEPCIFNTTAHVAAKTAPLRAAHRDEVVGNLPGR